MATIQKILVKVKTYADKNEKEDFLILLVQMEKMYADMYGMTGREVQTEVRSHDDFPKGKPGRPRNEVAPDTPEMERTHKRPRMRPPKDHSWDGDQGVYINSDGEPYQKVEKVPSGRPRGRPRTSEPKVASNRPKGRPPKGKMWSEDQGEYVDTE